MNKAERHDRILHLAGERGMIYLNRAAEATGASLPTIRRDFSELEKTAAVERVRGGIRVIRKEGNTHFNMRSVQHLKEKNRIARRAAALLKAGDVIFIDGGTTTFQLANHLPSIPLRIVTNSLRLSGVLNDDSSRNADWDIYITGGRIQHDANMLTGPGTVHTLDFYYADWAFLSVGGVNSDGLYNNSEAVVETERKMIERSDRSVVLADLSKMGKRSMCWVCGVEQVECIITEPPSGRSLVEEDLREKGCKIIHA